MWSHELAELGTTVASQVSPALSGEFTIWGAHPDVFDVLDHAEEGDHVEAVILDRELVAATSHDTLMPALGAGIIKYGWDGRTRTCECQDQNLVP